MYLVTGITFEKIDLADDGAAVQAFGHVQHVGDGVPVRSCGVVDAAVLVVAVGPMWSGGGGGDPHPYFYNKVKKDKIV